MGIQCKGYNNEFKGIIDLGSVEKYFDKALFHPRRNHNFIARLMFELNSDQGIKIVPFPRIIDQPMNQV